MPFVSFDVISDAAGLGRLHAHYGTKAVSRKLNDYKWVILGLGLVTGPPLIWAAIKL